ncbi:DUF2798 domain-containing protein [Vibrio hangzhouensis]|uniref:MFS transporter permease n=1 Tax=Vibrio hangzhouensis TaxID=462991 RepID=A0A1H6C1A9_9VIBR|nr:DUF2798 domain-containing protein [Vibrio hangzhouensis]MBY6195784.1 DUF2798 domain-containing protein [Vibrio hangzhouensis]SEG66728.1 Protein of unknown function [Vibrio hangzhouensis]
MNKKQFWLSTLLSSLTMAIMMSGIISGYKLGFSSDWPPVWLQSFLLAWPCALLLNLTVLPQVRHFAAWLSQPKQTN